MNDFIRKDVSDFMKKYGNLTVGEAIELNNKIKLNKEDN